MKHETEITLEEALKGLSKFDPIKVLFNNCVLYNDYDSDELCEGTKDTYGEIHPLPVVIPSRLHMYNSYVVTSIKIEIVQHHHSVVYITGRFDPKAAARGKSHGS